MKQTNVADALYRVKRGLVGYVSYLAACEMNQSFSEYILYEPVLRILTARGFEVSCEVPCPGFVKTGKGDFKKLDFVATSAGATFAIEVKWARRRYINVDRDIEKLQAYAASANGARAFLCVFGKQSVVANLRHSGPALQEQGNQVVANFGVTRYCCRIYRVTATKDVA